MTFREWLASVFRPGGYYKRLYEDLLNTHEKTRTQHYDETVRYEAIMHTNGTIMKDNEEKLSELRKSRLFLAPSNVRSNLFRKMIDEGVKDFVNINGQGIYVEDRNPMIYEIVNTTLFVNNARFSDSNFDGAFFGHIKFSNTDFKDVSFIGARFDEAKFVNCRFENCDFQNSYGENVVFIDCREIDSNISAMEIKTYANSCEDEFCVEPENYVDENEDGMEI